jgi:hypothetical protein
MQTERFIQKIDHDSGVKLIGFYLNTTNPLLYSFQLLL